MIYKSKRVKMTKFDCGCRIMTEVISLNEWKEPNWTYLLNTYVNMCGKCGKRQMKFQPRGVLPQVRQTEQRFYEVLRIIISRAKPPVCRGKWSSKGHAIHFHDGSREGRG